MSTATPAYSLRQDYLLWILVGVLLLFFILHPAGIRDYPGLVDWPTLGTLAGLLLLTAGIEASGILARVARRIAQALHSERVLACFLTALAAVLGALLTNDIALFIVVPLTLDLGKLAALPLRRLIVFEALAVNAGSMLTPIGNPQNIFLWQSSGVHGWAFVAGMLPPVLIAVLCLAGFILLGFRPRRVELQPALDGGPVRWRVFTVSACLFVPFLILADLHHVAWALGIALLVFLTCFRWVIRGLDWPLLLVFLLMFVDLRLVASLSAVQAALSGLDLQQPLTLYLTGVSLSQFISNVPATILLAHSGVDWRILAWGVDVGGFGLAIGSLANLIALRLGRQPGGWLSFHAWSLPFLLAVGGLTALWLRVCGHG